MLEDDVILVRREVPAPSDAETAGAAGDAVLDTSKEGVDSDPMFPSM